MFKQAEKVTENGLIAFQGLVVGLGDKIDISEIGNYIMYALQSKEIECARLACGIISDLSTTMEERMGEYLDDFVPCLHEILKDKQMHRSIKLPAFHALGDLAMYSGNAFIQKYFDTTMTYLKDASKMSVSVQGQSEDVLEFLSQLREVIIDQYIIIVMAVGDQQCHDRFLPHLPELFDFIEVTARIEGSKNPNALKLLIGLIGDIATQFPQNAGVKQKSTMAYIEEAIVFL